MVDFKTERRGQDSFLICTVDEDQLDTTVSNMLMRNKIDGLLDYAVIQMDRKRQLSYNITSKIPLSQFFFRNVKRKSLLQVFRRIIQTLNGAEDYLLFRRDVLLDQDHIYVSVNDGMCQLLALPVRGEQQEGAVLDFFRKLLIETPLDQNENRNYVAELLSFMNQPEANSNEAFLKKLDELEDLPVKSVRSQTPIRPQVPVQPVTAGVQPPQCTMQPAPKPASQPPIEKEKKHWFSLGGKREKKPKKEKKPAICGLGIAIPGVENRPATSPKVAPQPIPQPVQYVPQRPAQKLGDWTQHVQSGAKPLDLTQIDLSSEETVFMGDIALSGSGIPYLTLLRTGEKVKIDRFPFRIGVVASYVDFCVADNRAISRSHADIRQGDSGYYLVDNNSKNRSFIEGRPLEPGVEERLSPGTHFFLANEEFLFELR